MNHFDRSSGWYRWYNVGLEGSASNPFEAWPHAWTSNHTHVEPKRQRLFTEDEVRRIVRQEIAPFVKIDVPDTPPES